jgi:hypothetical protein
LIIAAVDRDDPRPVWYMDWGSDRGSGEVNLRRALNRVRRERGPNGYAKFKERLRIIGYDQFAEHTTTLPEWKIWVNTFEPPKDFATPRGLPMTYLIAPDGKVAKQFLGPVTARDIEAAIAKAGGPPAQEEIAAANGGDKCPDTAQHYRDKYVASRDKRDLACHRQALERESRL